MYFEYIVISSPPPEMERLQGDLSSRIRNILKFFKLESSLKEEFPDLLDISASSEYEPL